MHLSDLDLCSYCGGYDTIQSYIPLNEEHTLFIHVCEKCAAKNRESLVESFLKQHPSLRNYKGTG